MPPAPIRSTRAPGPLAAFLLAFALPLGEPAAQAPTDLRHELGARLRRFEQAWAEEASPERRRTAVAEVRGAVGAFFRGDVAGAARALDLAWLGIRGADSDADRFAAALQARPVRRLLDAGEPLRAVVEPFYVPLADGEEIDAPAGLVLVARWGGAEQRVPWSEDGVAVELGPPDGAASGPLVVTAELAANDWALDLPPAPASRVEDLEDRLRDLRSAAGRSADDRLAIEFASLRALAPVVEALAGDGSFEGALAPAELLAQAEALASAASDGAPLDLRSGGQRLLRIPVGDREIAVRLAPPPEGTGDSAPLVLALHGAGGSENMFFDGYGDGLAARLAERDRAWLCAPRSLSPADAGALLDALRERAPHDEERVFVLGHSMGAAAAVAAIELHPGRFARLAAIGGGGRVTDPAAWKDVPCLVVTGSLDFAKGGARALARALEREGAAVEFDEREGVEHLLVVQVALPDAFAFFAR